jgi:hypothetical protein
MQDYEQVIAGVVLTLIAIKALYEWWGHQEKQRAKERRQRETARREETLLREIVSQRRAGD